MFRIINMFVIVCFALCLAGCGGGSGGSTGCSTEVSIMADRLSPKDITISQGDRVVWTNNTTSSVVVTSGSLALDPDTSDTDDIAMITINADGSFTPDRDASYWRHCYGWMNNETTSVTVEILDESGTVITSIPVAAGDDEYFRAFPRIGLYTFRLSGADDVTGTIYIEGDPMPSGKFSSSTISPGKTYSIILNATGSQSYYVMVGSDTTGHITGTINVE